MSFSPVIRVRKLLEKMKSERNSPRLKRFPSRTLSEEAQALSPEIPPFRQRKTMKTEFTYSGENQFNFLPSEATLYILSFLEPQDLAQLRQVNKEMCVYADDDVTWKNLCMFDWGIDAPFTPTWKESYILLDDLCADGIWEGMSKWVEPKGFDNEQKTTARLHFVKRPKYIQQASRSSPTVLHRVDSQTVTPNVKAEKPVAARPSPYRIIGSGVTVNCQQPSPFKIEGERPTADPTGCTFEWNKHFEKHTSIYSGKMDFATRTVNGTISYSDGNTHWQGVFYYTKVQNHPKGKSFVMA